MAKALDLTGQQFGRLTAQYKCNYQKYGSAPWHCVCQCGNEVDVRTGDLRSGKTTSCGCLQREIASSIGKRTIKIAHESNIKDITGQKFGRLTAIECVYREIHQKTKWRCKCDCGNEIIVNLNDLTSGNTQSCGCIRSKGQEKIAQLLNQYNIPFEQEKKFDDGMYQLGNIYSKFRFDFYVNNQYVIEYDGEQHFKEVEFFSLSLSEQQERDKIKNEWCKQHNIPIIRIPYTQYNKLSIDDLKLDTSGFII